MNAEDVKTMIETYIYNAAVLEDAIRAARPGRFGSTQTIEVALAAAEAARENSDIARDLHAALGERHAMSLMVFGDVRVEFWIPVGARIVWSFVEHELERELWLNEVGDNEDANPRRDWRAPRPAPIWEHENIPY